MVAALMPFALASPENSCFQAGKPAAELPHCAASARGVEQASMAAAQTMIARRNLSMLNSSFASGIMPCGTEGGQKQANVIAWESPIAPMRRKKAPYSAG